MQLQVCDVMSSEVTTISSRATLDDAIARLLDTGADEIYVTDESGRVIGILPDYELLKARLNGGEPTLEAGRLASRLPAVLSPKDLMAEATLLFREGRHGRIAVVDQGRIVGQISRADVLRLHEVLRHLEFEPASSRHCPTKKNSDATPGEISGSSSLVKPEDAIPPGDSGGLRGPRFMAGAKIARSLESALPLVGESP